MSDKPDPGVGWRLLEIGEVIQPGDEYRPRYGGHWARRPPMDIGVILRVGRWPTRRRITADAPDHQSELARLQSDNADLRQQLADAESMSEQRACEIVNAARKEGRVRRSTDVNGWDFYLNRDVEIAIVPKPITKPVTLPPDKWAEIEAAIRAAGGSV